MAASTHAVAGAKADFQPLSQTTGGNLVTVVKSYSLTANASANDVYQMVKIPNGATIIDGYITFGASDPFTFTVGDGGSAARFIASASVSTAATTTAFIRKGVLPYKYSLTANANPQYDTIDVKLTAVTATVHVNWTLTVMYLAPLDQTTA